MQNQEEIVISGISGRFPESDNMEEFWENLINGVDLVTTNNRRWPIGFLGLPHRKGTLKADLTKFDASFFGIFPKQAERVDPQIRQLLEVTFEAIVDAGVNPTEIRGGNVGVYVGASAHDTFEACRKHPDIASGYDITGSACCMLANRLSYAFDFHGPSFCIDTFCSSSLMALHQAMAAIRAGECDSAIVSGVNLLMNPMTSLQILGVGALAPDGKCKVFDATGNGFVRSEAIVSLFIQKKDVARRSYGTLLHSKTNTDGYKVKGVFYPSGAVQQKLLETTYAESGINPVNVFYVEPHGTGTEAGDSQEINSITEVFTPGREGRPLLIGATKSNMGHAEPAAALCAVSKVALALKYGIIPQNLHFNSPNPNIPALLDGRIKVVSNNTPVTGDLVGVNSTGLGGSNIHLIIRANEKRGFCVNVPKIPVLVPISGRTEHAVQYALSKVVNTLRNFEFETLLQKISEVTTPGHHYRGFTILNEGEPAVSDSQEVPIELPPLWFVFSGMGTLWRGMTNDLMDIEIFAQSIHKSHDILKPLGMDLLDILLHGDDELLDKHMGTCFVAMGVAFIDMLTVIGLKPDGFIGHSAGELMCAYIDGVISQRDALICYFFKDECVLKVNGGAMAAVGLTWEEAQARCPEGVYPACHNGVKNVTISGPADKISQMVEELKSEGIFAREVSTGGVAYHSPYLGPILPTFEAHTRGIVVNSNPRSSKWKSSSIPESDWSQPITNAEYVVNNMRSPVLFHTTVQHIPENAVVLEVAAHALFVSVLKKSLPPSCNVLGLIRKGSGNNVTQFCTAVGKLYEFGYNVCLSPLYPKVEFPVSVETPMISPLVKWDHSKTHPLPDYLFNSSGAGESSVEVSLGKETDSFLAGHNIDGRVLYPATGYLVLVWKKFASLRGKPYVQLPVVFENVRFERATILPKEGAVKLTVCISDKTGYFQISEGESVTVTGTVRVAGNSSTITFDNSEIKKSSKFLPLNSDDIYKELRLQGYEYQGVFRGIKMADNDGKWAKIEWDDNWVGFLDTMLQFPVVCKETRGLYIPTRLQRAVIHPQEFFEMLRNNAAFASEGVPVSYNQKLETLTCPGIEFKGLKTSVAPRKATNQAPTVESVKFTPYFVEDIWSKEDALKFLIDLIIENLSSFSFTMREDVVQLNNNMSGFASTCVQLQPLRNVAATIVSEDPDVEAKEKLESQGIHVTSKAKDELVNCFITESEENLETVEALLKENGFILLKITKPHGALTKMQRLNLIATRRTQDSVFYLLRKKVTQEILSPMVINVDDSSFKWLLPLQEAMLKSSSNKTVPPIFITSFNNPYSGIMGMVNCLRQEPGGNKIRCLFSPNQAIDISNETNPMFQEIIQKDIVMNVIDSQGVLGSYRHFSLKQEELSVQETPYAYINVETRGDLSSLKFIEAPAFSNSLSSDNQSTEICEVYYAPLNFRDVMLATGKLPPEALPGKLATQDCILGLEFVGKDRNGRRVMGMVEAKGLATHVRADPHFMWEVPQKWSMEEAATVPVAYSTAYYSLVVRGRMQSGESVLIHSGSGGVGQAAIAIALSFNCKVFTTVGSDEKKEFLKKQFPQLKDENFSNSRDTTFEQHVICHTEGKGVDLVLNSLSEEKLQASIRCLAEGGRFLEIGKYDLSRNNSLGMAIFLKNITFHGILLDALFEKSSDEKREVVQLVSDGIRTGVVRPLPRTIFTTEEIEDAFRFMATGKHMGKVVITIKHETVTNQKASLVLARVRTFFKPTKSFIIVGGLGGFGIELADWLVHRGVRNIVLVSRSPVKNGYQSLAIRRWTSQGVHVFVVNTDVTTVQGAINLIKDAGTMGPIGGIFNLAMVLKDGFIENQSIDSFQTVTKPKIDGTMSLDIASRKLCPELEYFVVFSSAAAGRGNAGQTNYGLANSVMERICEERKRDNLPGLAIQFGAIGDVGVIQDHMGGNEVILGGTVPQRLSSCLNVLDIFMRNDEFTVVASTVLPEASGRKNSSEKLSLLSSVAKILGLKSVTSVTNKNTTLGELGIDSLMAVELKQILEWYADLTLSTPEIRELSWGKLEELDAGKH